MARPTSDLPLLVLSILARQSAHAYGIAKTIKQTSDGSLTFQANAVYPVLKRFEAQGWIKGHEVEEPRAIIRHYTTPTGKLERGKMHLKYLIFLRAKLKVLLVGETDPTRLETISEQMVEIEQQIEQFNQRNQTPVQTVFKS